MKSVLLILGVMAISLSVMADQSVLDCMAYASNGKSSKLVQDPKFSYPYVYTTVDQYDMEALLVGHILAMVVREKNAGRVLSKVVIQNFESHKGQTIELASPTMDSSIVCK